MKRLFLLALGACSLFGGIVFAVDPIQDNSPHDLGDYSCDVTSSVLYYAGTTNIYPADIFDGSTNLHWRISVVPNDSWYSIYNNGLFNAPWFQFGSNGKPINQWPVIAVSPLSPASIQTSIPTWYTRSQIASQIVYHLKRWAYTAWPFPNPIYYTPVGWSTQYTTINSSPNASTTQEDDECRNMYIWFCGDGVADTWSQTSFEGTPAQFASYALAGNEECDDGNTDPFDTCVTYDDNGSAVCALPYCGDGFHDWDGPNGILGDADDEDCDDGNNIDGDGCPSDCQFPPVPGVCGPQDGQQIYDFDNNWNALTATSPGLCDEWAVINFLYNTASHSWSWACSWANGWATDICGASEQRCGDGDVNMMEWEDCDGDWADCGPWQFTCTSTCTCVANPLDGVCGSTFDNQSFYDFDNNGNYLTATTPWLCANGQISNFVYNPTLHKRTRTCLWSNGWSTDSCQATELRCGDNAVNGAEACDGDATVCGPWEFTCTNACACLPNPVNGVCGSVDETVIYDFDNNGNALTATSPWLCADGNVSLFLYNAQTHTRSRQCVGLQGWDTAFCGAQELRCGDNVVNGAEECDGSATLCGPWQWTCTTCTCIPNPEDGVCGSTFDNQSFYDFDNNGNYLTATTPGLCANGVVNSFTYDPIEHLWLRNCLWSNQWNDDACQATELRCGDDTVNGAETCDGGWQAQCDDNYLCQQCDCSYQPNCGNGVTDPGEACDDGNTNNTDECTNSCELTYCGDGITQNPNGQGDNERCDDGNLDDTDTCTTMCMETYCGDGITQNPNASGQEEECDDGNGIDTDGCSNTCQSNPLCGNGVLDPGEDCDDGNNSNGDGCSNSCNNEYCGDNYRDTNGPDNITGNADDEACEQDIHCPVPWSDCTSSCDCVPPALTRCGDGIVQSPNSSGQYEECDDGNTIDTDACRNNCTLPGGWGSSCESLTLTTTTQNVPTQIGYTCLWQWNAVQVQLFTSTWGLLASATTAVGSFYVTTPDTYTIVCSYDGITSQACQRTVDLGGYCKDLVATQTTWYTYTFACSWIGDNYLLVISDSQNHVVSSVTATGDFTYTYTFTTPGTYTAVCFVDGVSNTTCTDGTWFTTQAYTSSFGENTVGILRTSPTTRIVSAPHVDYRTNGFTSVASLSATLEDYALAKWMKTYLSTLDAKTITSVTKPKTTVVKTDFAKKVTDITAVVDKQLKENCYNACLETIVIGWWSTWSCLLTTDPTTTSVKASSLTVTWTCAFSGLTGTPSLACGNGTVFTWTSWVCFYTGYNTWTMQCLLDNKAYPWCEKPIHTYKWWGWGGWWGWGRHGWCGDGIPDAGEACDDGAKNGTGSICSLSCTLKWFSPTIKTDAPPKCASIDPPSIQLGEILPFWWAMEDDVDIIATTECRAWSEGKIPASSLRCYFTVQAPDDTTYKVEEPCTTDALKTVAWYDDLQKDLWVQLSPKRWQSYTRTNKRTADSYGEYTITLDKVTYALCTKTAPATSWSSVSYAMAYGQSYEGRVCQYNFAVTTPYFIQKWTSLSSFVDDVTTLEKFLRVDWKKSILDMSKITLLEKTSSSDAYATMKKTVYKEADKAVQSLTVEHPLWALTSWFKKVPNQEIYSVDNWFTIRHRSKSKQFNEGKPTTIIVKGAVEVTIRGSLPGNLLLIAPEGTVTFVNEDCDVTDTIEATIVASKIKATWLLEQANRSLTSKEWCTDGKLVIKGVLVSQESWWIAQLRSARRSTLNDWFDGTSSKADHIYAWASLRIESRPSVWSSQPPLATKNTLFFRTQSHGSAGDQLPLPLPILESLLVLLNY